VLRSLPTEDIVYFGDTAHLPFGDKSARTIKLYSSRISEFLVEKNCKAIVIACNTASSIAYELLRDTYDEEVPIISVIDPTVSQLISEPQYRRIGIIGTRATIRSRVYQQKILSLDPSRLVFPLATPLLVPMIEEGYFNDHISTAIINTYLESADLKDIDCLVLACTHYPLIKQEIERWYNGATKVIDSAEWVANYLCEVLAERSLLSQNGGDDHHFYVSDLGSSFRDSARVFFGHDVVLEQVTELL